MKLRHALSSALFLSVALAGLEAEASTGVCDSNPPTTTTACINQIQASGGVVNDVFKDSNGRTATQLPVFGKLFNVWQGCPQEIQSMCAGTSNAPYDCPGEYTCSNPGPVFSTAATYVNALDRKWFQPCRLANPALHDVGGGKMCPQDFTCIADGTGGNYDPWEGLVFDLGGPSNKVAIFAENDHGPQPCESLEYTVFLTDNPHATDLVLHPATDGVDPQKWNRAVLSKIYTQGFVAVRPPDPTGHASCGDTTQYSVEEDSFVQVFALPCGITFRYASIVAGNDGLDFPACAYDSQEAELDAVAGLTESGAGVCPDVDGDHYVDCNCPGAPTVCDCNDADPNVHPGAPEACDSPDVNCDGKPGSCSGGLVCNAHLCVPTCGGEISNCPAGSNCTDVGSQKLCVPQDCTTGGCPPGGVCKAGSCVPACTGVVCPGTQVCEDGACVDPCAHVTCPAGQVCQGGACTPPCICFAGDSGCGTGGAVCDVGRSNLCVAPSCKGVTCGAGMTCDSTSGTCVSFCNANVKCPSGEKCVDPDGCVPLCQGVTCTGSLTCDPATGTCVDTACKNVTCFPPATCVAGQCVDTTDGGTDAGDDGGADASAGDAGGAAAAPSNGGCGCSVPGDAAPMGAAGAAALLGLVLARRRSRRRA